MFSKSCLCPYLLSFYLRLYLTIALSLISLGVLPFKEEKKLIDSSDTFIGEVKFLVFKQQASGRPIKLPPVFSVTRDIKHLSVLL